MALPDAPLSRPAYAVPLLPPLELNYESEEMRLRQLEAVEHGEPASATDVEHSCGLPLQTDSPLPSPPPSRLKQPTALQGAPQWIPTSLKRSYLLTLATLSISLSICCFVLVALSHVNNGIANAGSSGGFNFRKRFLPTFIAVLYTLLWTPVVADVIRTEPWALLSRATGAQARDSLLKRDQLWWSHIADAVLYELRSDWMALDGHC